MDNYDTIGQTAIVQYAVTVDNSSAISGKGKNYILTPNNDGINETVMFGEFSTIKIYTQTGKLLKTLNTPLWDSRDESGKVLKSGVYIYQILDNNKLTTGTITVIR